MLDGPPITIDAVQKEIAFARESRCHVLGAITCGVMEHKRNGSPRLLAIAIAITILASVGVLTLETYPVATEAALAENATSD